MAKTENGVPEAAQRTELPRCQYGVFLSWEPEPVACDEPAVAKWTWPEDEDCSGGTLYVCELHDRAVEETEWTEKGAPDGKD